MTDMEDPKINTKVVHSLSNPAWNIVGQQVGAKYKIARVPYDVIDDSEILSTKNEYEALIHAQFISQCFNRSEEIVRVLFNMNKV